MKLAAFFGIVFGASLLAYLAIGLLGISPLAAFPFMVLSIAAAGIGMTWLVEGRGGVRRLLARILRWRVPPVHYLAAAAPAVCILVTLLVLSLTVSSDFTPQLFWIGLVFGVVAGFFEEIGWSGFAYPRLAKRAGALWGAVVLGVLWALWHLPIVDSLGAASPHGRALPLFFLAFGLVLVALRILISWNYEKTGSLLLAQLTHASSTGFLVVLGPPRVSAPQEAAWYAVYALVLGAVALAFRP